MSGPSAARHERLLRAQAAFHREALRAAIGTELPCIQAVVQYTARTPTYGRLREAVAVAIEPARSPSQAASNAHGVGIESRLV